MRYNPKERIGVNITEQIFIEDFDWIFRELTTVDVGIDAFVEQAEEGDPKGKFIALQIKSGEGNFHISSDKLTYYLSKVHYEYWTNFDLPVILIAHLTEEKKTYWQEISRRKIIKTDKKWKLEIPMKNLLNKKAKLHITKLLTAKDYNSNIIKIFQGKRVEESSLHDLDARVDLISDATDSTIKTIQILEELQIRVRASGEKFREHNLRGEYFNTHPAQKTMKTLAKDINLGARRLEQEISIFSEVFGEGISAFEQAVMIYFNITKDIINLQENLITFEILSPAIQGAINGVKEMKKGFEEIPEELLLLQSARNNGLKVINLIIDEYEDAKQLTDNVVVLIKSKL